MSSQAFWEPSRVPGSSPWDLGRFQIGLHAQGASVALERPGGSGACFPFTDVTVDLHSFFRSRLIHPVSTTNPTQDYGEFISCMQLCISELEKEDLEDVVKSSQTY